MVYFNFIVDSTNTDKFYFWSDWKAVFINIYYDRRWLFFVLVDLDAGTWLAKYPEEGPQDNNYEATSEVAITDYIRCTRNVNRMLDDIIHVGKDRRSLMPNLKRENLLNP